MVPDRERTCLWERDCTVLTAGQTTSMERQNLSNEDGSDNGSTVACRTTLWLDLHTYVDFHLNLNFVLASKIGWISLDFFCASFNVATLKKSPFFVSSLIGLSQRGWILPLRAARIRALTLTCSFTVLREATCWDRCHPKDKSVSAQLHHRPSIKPGVTEALMASQWWPMRNSKVGCPTNPPHNACEFWVLSWSMELRGLLRISCLTGVCLRSGLRGKLQSVRRTNNKLAGAEATSLLLFTLQSMNLTDRLSVFTIQLEGRKPGLIRFRGSLGKLKQL